MRPPHSDFRSDSSGLFVRSGPLRGMAARSDINPDYGFARTPNPPRRIILDDVGRVVQEGPSETGTFGNRDPTTSEADIAGGTDQGLIWGTTIFVEDTQRTFDGFLRNFTKSINMHADKVPLEEIENSPDANTKPYLEALETMLLLGTNKLFFDIGDLKLYPPTRKLWHQLILYAQEVIPLMDQTVKHAMTSLAAKAGRESNNIQGQLDPSQNSEPALPGSDMPHSSAATEVPTTMTIEEQVEKTEYCIRPFGMEKTINLRDLNPSGKTCQPESQSCHGRLAY